MKRFFRPRPNNELDNALPSFSYELIYALVSDEKNERVLGWKIPRVVVASPVNFVAMRAVTIVQEFVVDEAFSGPRTCHECQFGCWFVKWDFFILLIVSIVNCESSVHMRRRQLNCHILWSTHKRDKRKFSIKKETPLKLQWWNFKGKLSENSIGHNNVYWDQFHHMLNI